MSSSKSFPLRLSSGGINRRKWAALMAAVPALAQVAPPVPATPDAKLQKAYDEVRRSSTRLAQIQLPMNVEPAFSFKA